MVRCGRGACVEPPTSAQILCKLAWQIARKNPVRRAVDVVRDSNELNADVPLGDIEQDIARPPIAILRPADAPSIYEVNAVDLAVPRDVRMAECDQIARVEPRVPRHLAAEAVRP